MCERKFAALRYAKILNMDVVFVGNRCLEGVGDSMVNETRGCESRTFEHVFECKGEIESIRMEGGISWRESERA